MARVKRGIIAAKRRRKILKYTKGFKWGRKSKERAAKEALLHAWTHAFRDRRVKKRTARGLWQIRLNAAVRPEGLNYSKFMHGLKKAKIELDRKVLSEIAMKHPEIFKEIVTKVK
ncbi:50S ribosomal protein L20 [Candidatus Azambacteria bacterium RIFOXYD1_FULL_42_11]|uniref:Large ribosomal subunit protein bL20 n=4 Tax=Candidatus Azamiibacteriota TaxID=1752741 RepID=A0A0G1BIY2_9BACT|nr:MAG: 50S ribosomal protein L20 [Candidatus Azambacteria bacterium GW2011_GWB1_42_17]KKS46236.1 MAG: 50S ribosomal protein L20 [Candidatus Azambacteria bacterium GW2011_GWA1_42_19]KKS75583.1 MAG: 50S ribosomal protein L20 [Candidatus Azambacteria bacterium GW2011_GWA2_42_9]KKS88810.1 MAG: 50S ribosomal protein L20 [Parcubacteria group bacterium GW2011_GWC1_43_11]OGD43255.1 MAG: 50S ribosomal protein L20 [Candidatus Azambacteria bacterium RIFOXYD1_FULL_42_11]